MYSKTQPDPVGAASLALYRRALQLRREADEVAAACRELIHQAAACSTAAAVMLAAEPRSSAGCPPAGDKRAHAVATGQTLETGQNDRPSPTTTPRQPASRTRTGQRQRTLDLDAANAELLSLGRRRR